MFSEGEKDRSILLQVQFGGYGPGMGFKSIPFALAGTWII